MMQNKNIDKGKPFDWGRASEQYALYRDIYPPAFYRQILDFGLCTKGQRVLDLGTGTGVLPRNLHHTGARFIGIDISEGQIAQARRLNREAGLDIEYQVCPVDQMDFPADSFDVALACQCFFYFDIPTAVPAIKRLLVNWGRLAILFMAWLPGESEVARASEELVLRHSPDWSGANMQRGLPPIPEWANVYGFSVQHNIGFALDVEFTKQSWNGRMVACRGVGASLPPEKVAAFEREHRSLLDTLAPDGPFTIPHYATMQVLQNEKPG